MKTSRKCKDSLRERATEINEGNSKAELARNATIESIIEGPSIIIGSEGFEDLPASTGIEDGYSSDDEHIYDEDYDEKLTSEDISAIYSDWFSEMKRIDKQKMAVMLYNNYVNRMSLQKTEAAKEVGLFLGMSDKTVRLWRKKNLCVMMASLVRTVEESTGNI